QGIVRPGRVGPDGKIHPVEHILELQDASPNVNGNEKLPENDEN
uniref:Uncharacterized protein n=1 Tax=Romanomermis culicivorax TaxID=13658 RepID=A0A915HRU4_ROMCU